MEKNELVEVASFTNPNDTDILESLFQKEGIDYYLQNTNSASVIAGVDVFILVKKQDVARAVDLIRRSGFEAFLTDLEI